MIDVRRAMDVFATVGCDNETVGCVTFTKKFSALDNRDALETKLQLAIVCDGGKPLVATCYILEEDGFIAPRAHELRQALLNHFK